jgi:8-oxo-dGTP diphosphatase
MGVKDQGLEHSRHRYQVVPRTLIFITHGERVLLLKGAPSKKIWANLYNGVGGHIEPGESILAAAKREAAEEVGLTDLNDWKLCGTVHIEMDDPLTGILLFVFRAVSSHDAVRASLEGTPEWVDWTALPPESMVEDLLLLLPRVLAMRVDDPPFYGRYYYDDQDRWQIVLDA